MLRNLGERARFGGMEKKRDVYWLLPVLTLLVLVAVLECRIDRLEDRIQALEEAADD